MKKSWLNKGFAVPRIGLGGRLALLWWDNLDIDAQTSSPNHINTLVNQDDVVWRLLVSMDIMKLQGEVNLGIYCAI